MSDPEQELDAAVGELDAERSGPRPSPTPALRPRTYKLWLCDNCDQWAEQALGETCEQCEEGKIIEVVCVPLAASSPLPAGGLSEEELKAKLDEMTLHDNTRDPMDVGYMAAVTELREWLARLVSAPNREEGERG